MSIQGFELNSYLSKEEIVGKQRFFESDRRERRSIMDFGLIDVKIDQAFFIHHMVPDHSPISSSFLQFYLLWFAFFLHRLSTLYKPSDYFHSKH